MIKQNYALNACKGMWPIPAVRPLSGWYEHPITYWGRWKYPSGLTGSSAAKSDMSVSPIYTKHWLIRNGLYQLSGNSEITPVPPFGIVSTELQSDRGWAVGDKTIKVPRTLLIVITGLSAGGVPVWDSSSIYGGFSFTNSSWFGDIFDQRKQELNSLGIDAYMIGSDASINWLCPSESFSTTVYSPASMPGTYVFATDYSNFIDLNDVVGGEVMIVQIEAFYSGYADYYAFWYSNSPSDSPADYEYINGIDGYPTIPPPPATAKYISLIASTKKSIEDFTALLQISQKCSKFAFDMYANSNAESVYTVNYQDPQPFDTLYQADARFRNGVPGSIYYCSLQGIFGRLPGEGQAEAELTANQIIDRALAFFS